MNSASFYHSLDKVSRVIIYLFIFLFPVFYLPVTTDPYDFNKLLLLIVVASLLTLLSLGVSILKKEWTIPASWSGLLLLILAAAAVLSTVIQSPYKIGSLATPFAAPTYITALLLFLHLQSNRDNLNLKLISALFIAAAASLSIYIILMFINIIPENIFTPAGTLFTTSIFLSLLMIHLIIEGSQKLTQKELLKKPLETALAGITLILITVGLAIIIYHFITSQKPLILPARFGWLITLEIVKNIKTFLLGVGPTNFVVAFTVGKPLSYNFTPFWNITFTSSSSFFLNLVTEMGIPAGIAYLLLLVSALKNTLKRQIFSLVAAIGLFSGIFLPLTMTVFLYLVILLAVSQKSSVIKLRPKLPLLIVISSILSLVILPLFYLTGRLFLAELNFKSSLDTRTKGIGTDIYNLQKQAIDFNPYNDRYRLAFSQTNLALANTLAGKNPLEEEDKQNIPRLVQQAIESAQIAVKLNKTNAQNWDNLASLYSSLLSFAQGSDKWAEESFKQKLILDPKSPTTRISFGGLYLSLKRFPEAQQQFQEAVLLKPDFANAHFNLAIAYKEQGKIEDARYELEEALRLVEPGSQDAQKIEKEQENLRLPR